MLLSIQLQILTALLTVRDRVAGDGLGVARRTRRADRERDLPGRPRRGGGGRRLVIITAK